MKRLIALLFLAVPALAQVRESVTVELVEVPVYVTARDGKPVRGLTKESFELFVDGKRQPIEVFDAVDFAAPAAQPNAAARPLRERRLYLLLFDYSFATPERLKRAQRAAEQAVRRSNPQTDYFAVATYSSRKGVQFLSSFLHDPAAVLRALYTLRPSEANDPLGLALSDAERATWIAAADRGGGVSADQEDVSSMVSGEMAEALKGGEANQELVRQPRQRLIEYQLGNLGDVAARLGGLEGQKHVIFFTEGFDSTRVTDIKAANAPPKVDSRLLRFVEEMHDTFVSAGVMLDTVDIKGVRHTFADLDNDALYMLARDTGGRVVANRNDLAEAIGGVTTAQSAVYILGFNPRGRKKGRISVKVHGAPRGSEVSYREGYGFVETRKSVDPLQLADILVNDIPQNGITLTAGADLGDGGAEIAVAFSRAEVVPQLTGEAAVDVFIYLFDEKGRAVAMKSRRLTFDANARVASGYLTLRERFALPKGTYAMKVLAQVAGSTSMGFIRRDFTID